MSRIGKWWCRHIHSGDWTTNNYWVMKFKHIIGDANEEWMQEYHECEKCGRIWVYWDNGVDTWYPDNL